MVKIIVGIALKRQVRGIAPRSHGKYGLKTTALLGFCLSISLCFQALYPINYKWL